LTRDGGIGAPQTRKEDARFLTGRGRYTSDIDVPGQAHAAFVRSTHAHARIARIDAATAAAMPGVIAVLTGDDLRRDGLRPLPLDFTVRNFDGSPMHAPTRHALTTERARYAGEPLAIVIAENANTARDAAERVAVEYEPLPVVVDVAQAAAPGAALLWEEAPGNVCCEFRYGDGEKTAAAFAAATHRVKLTLRNNRIAVNPMEPRAAIGRFDPVEDAYTLIVSHQSPFPLRTQLCEILSLPEQRLRVISPDVGGGFGVKAPTYPEEAVVLWAARRCGRAVKWVCDRSELFLSDAQARDHLTTIELALDAQGTILSVRVEDLANLGAYVSSFGAGPPILGQASLLAGAYRVPVLAGRVRMMFSNTQPVDTYRGPGRAECAYMLERVVDLAAARIGISAVAIRQRNLVPASAMPWKSPTGRIYDSGDFPAVLEKTLERCRWSGFDERRREARGRGKLRGFGLAYYVDHTGMGPSSLILSRGMKIPSYESAQVRLNKDAGVTVFTGTHSHGQGLDTAFAQIVHERLGVAIAEVEVRHGDTAELGYGRGTVGARSLLAGGAALEVAIGKIVAKGKRIAAHILECAQEDIAFRDGSFSVEGTDRAVTLAEVARAAYLPLSYPMGTVEPGLDETCYWDPTQVAIPNGCHACEVEIDPDTGALAVVSFVSVDDFGNIVNPLLVAGQVHGGVAQGLGQALLEQCAYDSESGQLLSGSFLDYCMPRADNMPPIDHEAHLGHPCATNPLGVKGCGEAGAIGAPPALVNAVVDALRDFGVEHIDMPVTPEKIWRHLARV
jgi:aerobic carbon-monoxide dehydrogenase large subunit